MLTSEPAPNSGSDQLENFGVAARAPRPAAPLETDRPSTVSPRLVAFIEVVLCSDFPTQILLMAMLSAAGWSPVEPSGRLSLLYVSTLLILDAVVLTALIFGILRFHGEQPRQLFLGRRRIWPEMRLGLAVTPAILMGAVTVLALIQRYAPFLHTVAHNPLEDMLQRPGDTWVFLVIAVVAGGLREELQRAFILRRFEQHLGGAVMGLVIFSLVFGLGHIIQGLDTAIVTVLLGAIWGLIYLWRRSALAPIISHSAFNVFEIIFFKTFS